MRSWITYVSLGFAAIIYGFSALAMEQARDEKTTKVDYWLAQMIGEHYPTSEVEVHRDILIEDRLQMAALTVHGGGKMFATAAYGGQVKAFCRCRGKWDPIALGRPLGIGRLPEVDGEDTTAAWNNVAIGFDEKAELLVSDPTKKWVRLPMRATRREKRHDNELVEIDTTVPDEIRKEQRQQNALLMHLLGQEVALDEEVKAALQGFPKMPQGVALHGAAWAPKLGLLAIIISHRLQIYSVDTTRSKPTYKLLYTGVEDEVSVPMVIHEHSQQLFVKTRRIEADGVMIVPLGSLLQLRQEWIMTPGQRQLVEELYDFSDNIWYKKWYKDRSASALLDKRGAELPPTLRGFLVAEFK